MSDSTTRVINLPLGLVLKRAWYARLVLGIAVIITAIGTLVLQRACAQADQERFATAVNIAEDRLARHMDLSYRELQQAAELLGDGRVLSATSGIVKVFQGDLGKAPFTTVRPDESGQSGADSGIPIATVLRVSDVITGASFMQAEAAESGELITTRTLQIFGRSWVVTYRSTAAFDAGSNRTMVPLFAGVGLGAAIGLFLLSRAQLRSAADNSALYMQAMTARREAEISLGINRRLASTLDPHAVAQSVTDAGCELTGADVGAFFSTTGQEAPVIHALSGNPELRLAIQGLAWTTTLFDGIVDDTGVLNFADVRLEARHRREHLGDIEVPRLASCLTIAVRLRTGKVLGGLVFAHHEPVRFSADHERLLLGLADQAAIAFDHAHLYSAESEARRIAGLRADDLSRANAELQQFIYVSSHDLQEPLRTITQYLDLLQRRHGGLLDGEARRYITYASESAVRMYTLLNDLLTYSRLGHDSEHTRVDLGEVLEEVLQDLRLVLSENAARIEIGMLPSVLCDRTKIRTLFQNLIGNAVKFRGLEAPVIEFSAQFVVDGGWTIAVLDRGIGIRRIHHEAVFEVFHRLHEREAYPGTGIGLAICRRIVEQHGGRIWVEDTVGGGATFRFNLPETGTTRVTRTRLG